MSNIQYTYINTTSSSTTPAQVVNTDGRSIVIRKIMIGNPVTGGNITIHYTNNALSNDTTTIAYKHTFPTFSTTNINSGPNSLDFRAASPNGSTESDGLVCGMGASIVIDQTMQLLVLWDYTEGN